MKDRGKAIEIPEAFSSEPPCRKHPSSSSVGICALCLKDRLIKLVCSDCGEPRLSSCSCSDISSNRNSLSVDVGTVGPISFLIHNDKYDRPTSKYEKHPLKRSSSTCLDGRRSSFWHMGWFSKRKSQHGGEVLGRKSDGWDQKCRIWDLDDLGPSQSSSSDVRKSKIPQNASGAFEQEGDETDSEFFDLNVALLSSESKSSFRDGKGGEALGRVTSCRVTVNEIEGKGSRRGAKVLKWFYRQSSERNSKK